MMLHAKVNRHFLFLMHVAKVEEQMCYSRDCHLNLRKLETII